MVKHVIKRDGRVVDFNNQKIVSAILKAMDVTDAGEDIVLAAKIADAISKIDKDGKLVSAHYGKIYGRWGVWGGTRAEMMFFNTTPNDTNLEDMKTYKESELRMGR